jgi:hypothetical protein
MGSECVAFCLQEFGPSDEHLKGFSSDSGFSSYYLSLCSCVDSFVQAFRASMVAAPQKAMNTAINEAFKSTKCSWTPIRRRMYNDSELQIACTKARDTFMSNVNQLLSHLVDVMKCVRSEKAREEMLRSFQPSWTQVKGCRSKPQGSFNAYKQALEDVMAGIDKNRITPELIRMEAASAGVFDVPSSLVWSLWNSCEKYMASIAAGWQIVCLLVWRRDDVHMT